MEDREDDMVNVSVNTKTCHNISLLPLRNSTNKSVIKPQNNFSHLTSDSDNSWCQILMVFYLEATEDQANSGESVAHQKMAQKGAKT